MESKQTSMWLIIYTLKIDDYFIINGKEKSNTISSLEISNPDNKVIALVPQVETEVEMLAAA